MNSVNIATNPIDLRIATDSERNDAIARFITPKEERQNTGGYSIYMDAPIYALVSETAFPGRIAIYAGCVNSDGELDSAGWMGTF